MSCQAADDLPVDANATQLVAILEETVSFFKPRGCVQLRRSSEMVAGMDAVEPLSNTRALDAGAYPNSYRLSLWDGLEVALSVEPAEAREVRALVMAARALIETVREVREAGLDLWRGRAGVEFEGVSSRVHLTAKVAVALREWGSAAFLRIDGEAHKVRELAAGSVGRAAAVWLVPDGSVVLAFQDANDEILRDAVSRVLLELEKHGNTDVAAGFVVAEYGMDVAQVVDAVLETQGPASELLEFICHHALPLSATYSILELRRALPNGGVSIAYQPIIDIRRNCVVGVESFVRWEHPLRRWRGAQEILNLAEAVSLTPALGWFVTSEAVGQIADREWPAPVRLHLNASASQMNHPGFARMLVAAAAESSVGIVAEFQEREVPLIEHEPLSVLLDGGVELAVDNFASGSADLRYLTWFHPSVLKVSLCGWEGLTVGRERYLCGLVGCAARVGAELYATCVEYGAVADGLRELGVSHAQGDYYFSPAGLSEFT
jgi:EAL domain-containing protein (putative c-di-GMP-specific phosphodiesterase class I)